jgi:tetratricopeptide (TPR) repeat protein
MKRSLLFLFVFAFVLRLLHGALAEGAGLYHGLFLDSRYYAERAAAIAAGLGAGDHPYLLSPLYPYVLACFVDDQGELNVGAVRWLQALVGSCSVLLSAALAQRFAGRKAFWIAGLLAASFGPLVHFDGTILVASLQGFFLTLGLWLLLCSEDEGRSAKTRLLFTAACGWAWGVSAALRPTGLILIGASAGILFLQFLRQRPRGSELLWVLGRPAALLVAAGLMVLPFSLRNLRVSGEAVLLSANGGVNLWIGNHREASGVFRLPPDYDFLHDPLGVDVASKAEGRRLSYQEASRWWSDRAWQDIQEDWGRWLQLLGTKLLLFAHPKEIPQLGQSYQWFRQKLWTLWLPLDGRVVLLFALLAPLALLASQGRGGWQKLAWPYVLLLVYALAISLFFVTGRYRVPVMPTAIALAAATVVGLLQLWRQPKRRPLGIAISISLLVLLLGSIRLYGGPLSIPDSSGVEERQRGMSLYKEGRFEAATQAYRESLRLAESPLTRNNLANALKALGRLPEAEAEYRKALQLNSRDAVAWYNFGNLQRNQLRNFEAAEQAYRRSIELRPRMAEAHFNLGAVLMDRERFVAAVAAIEEALKLAPPQAPWRQSAMQALLRARALSRQ